MMTRVARKDRIRIVLVSCYMYVCALAPLAAQVEHHGIHAADIRGVALVGTKMVQTMLVWTTFDYYCSAAIHTKYCCLAWHKSCPSHQPLHATQWRTYPSITL